MRLIILEKTIDIKDSIDDLNTVNLEEDIEYLKNNEGVNIKGFIEIEGEYLHGSQIKYFNDILNIDLLAPYDELSDKDNISLKQACVELGFLTEEKFDEVFHPEQMV